MKSCKTGWKKLFQVSNCIQVQTIEKGFQMLQKTGKGFSNYLTLVKYTPHQVSLRGNLTTQKKIFHLVRLKINLVLLKNKMLSSTFLIYIIYLPL